MARRARRVESHPVIHANPWGPQALRVALFLETVGIRTGAVVNGAPVEPQSRTHGPRRRAVRIPPQLTRNPLGAASEGEGFLLDFFPPIFYT